MIKLCLWSVSLVSGYIVCDFKKGSVALVYLGLAVLRLKL